MLSPGRLLHLVFADANDTYFCSETLALDLYQYLWLKLHEQGFHCVYFLTKREDEALPEITTFGDAQAKPFEVRNRFWGRRNARRALCDWIAEQLSENGKRLSAIVCAMEDFCALFGDDDSREFLKKLSDAKKRRGSLILTASPEAEASKPLLLESEVFESLNEPGIVGVRKAGPCEMYGFIKASMGEGMTYLNTFTRERLHCLLSRLLSEDPQRLEKCHLQKHMEDYLLQWMNQPAFRNAEQSRGIPLPNPDVSFQMLYNKLREKAAWSALAERAQRVAQSDGIRAYASKTAGCDCAEDPQDAVAVQRDRNTAAGRCAALTPASRLDPADPNCGQIIASLASLRNAVCSPRNLPENEEVQEILNDFVLRYNALCSADRLDTDRILYCVKAILFFAENVYDTGEEGRIQALRDCAELHRMWLDGCESVNMALRWAIHHVDGPQLRNTSEMVMWAHSILSILDEEDSTGTSMDKISIEVFRMKAHDAILSWKTLEAVQTKLGQTESELITSGWNGAVLDRLKELFDEQKAVNDRSDELRIEKTGGLTWEDRY